MDEVVVRPIGRVESTLADPADARRPLTGVLCARSSDRPHPVGLRRVRASDLEAVDGTPVVDLKPVLAAVDDR